MDEYSGPATYFVAGRNNQHGTSMAFLTFRSPSEAQACRAVVWPWYVPPGVGPLEAGWWWCKVKFMDPSDRQHRPRPVRHRPAEEAPRGPLGSILERGGEEAV